MNQGKNAAKANRAGLARFRPLTPQSSYSSTQQSSRSNLPNGWYFNESREQEFWNDLELEVSKEKQDELEESTKQADFLTQMGDTSKKISSIIKQIDHIDQETLLQMMSIADNSDNDADADPNTFLDESKSQILTFITEMKDLSESQQELVESLKTWFGSLQNNEVFLNKEKDDQPSEPDREDVYNFLTSIVHKCTERSEKAQNLHKDVSDFWMRQMASFKKIIYTKDVEIYKLKQSIDNNSNTKGKRNRQKQAQRQKADDLKTKNEQIESQIKTIEDQKLTIEKLKKQLQDSEASRAAVFANQTSSTDALKSQLIEKDNIFNNSKLESEAKMAVLSEKILIITSQNEQIHKQLTEEKMKTSQLQKQLSEKDEFINELEAKNHKNLQLLALQEKKLAVQKPGSDAPSETEDHLLEIVKLHEEIKRIHQDHKKELLEQQAVLREKFLIEKEKLIEAGAVVENKETINNIVLDYEGQLKAQKEEFDNLNTNIARSWGAKISILTRQYDNRIKALNTSHEMQLLCVRNNANFEMEKKRIELEDEFNKKFITEVRKQYEPIDNTTDKYEIISNKLQKTKAKYIKLKYFLKNFAMDNPQFKNEIDELFSVNKSFRKDEITDEMKLIERLTFQIQKMKEEYEEQINWLLSKQKQDFERQSEEMTCEHQKEIRLLMLKVQDSISNVCAEGETQLTIDEATNSIADMLIKLNEHLEEADTLKPALITVEEANKQMKRYTDQIQHLTSLLDSCKKDANESIKTDMEEDNANLNEYKNEIEQLKERIKILENMQSGNDKETLELMKKMEEKLRKEIQYRDVLIEQFQNDAAAYSMKQKQIENYEITDSLIFHFDGNKSSKEQAKLYELMSLHDLKERSKVPLQRSLPDFIELKDVTNPKKQFPSTHTISRTPSQISNLTIDKKDTFLNAQPETIPVILQLNDTKKESSTEEKLNLEPPKNSEEELKQLQVRTIGKKSMIEKNEKKKPEKFSGRILVEVSTQNDLTKPSIFQLIDAGGFDIQESHSLLKPDQSFFFDTNPNTISISKKGKGRNLQYAILVDLEPALSPEVKPVKVEADKEMLQTIEDLQAKLLEMEKSQRETEHSNSAKNDMFTQMRIAVIDTSNKIIARQKEIIKELSERPPEVVVKTQILRVPDVQLEPLPPIRQNKYYASNDSRIDYKNDPSIPRIEKSSNSFNNQIFAIGPAVEEAKVEVHPEIEEKHNANDDEERRKSNIYTPPATPERHPPTPIHLDLEVPNEDDSLDDPFTSSILLLASCIRFMSNFSDNENHIYNTFKSDTNAYEAFLAATGSNDESSMQFLSTIKENEKCYANNLIQLDHFSEMQMKLLHILKLGKKRANGLAQSISELKSAAVASELENQCHIIADAQHDGYYDDKNASPLSVLHKLESSLEVVTKLGLHLSNEEFSRYNVLTKRVKDCIEQCVHNKTVLTQTIEGLIAGVQNFISSIKPSSSKSTSDIIASSSRAELRELKTKIKLLKKARDKYRKEAREATENQDKYEAQIRTLKSRITEEKELNDNAVSLYQSQITMMKDLFKSLNIESSKDPLGVTSAVRDQVLSIQAVMETAISERDALKTKAADLEDNVTALISEVNKLNGEIEELTDKNNELELLIRKTKAAMLFHESDIETLKKEREADGQIVNQHKMQLQEIIARNEEANDEFSTMTEKLARLKNEIKILKNEKDKLTIKNTLNIYKDNRATKPSVGTQTILRIIGNKTVALEGNMNQVISEDNNHYQIQYENESNEVSHIEADISNHDNDIEHEIVPPIIGTPQLASLSSTPQDSKSLNDDSSFHSISQDKIESLNEKESSKSNQECAQSENSEEHEGETDFDYNDEEHKEITNEQFNSTQGSLNSTRGFNYLRENHAHISRARERIAREKPNPKLNMITTTPDDTSLAIGNSIQQGKRPLTGQIGRIRPTVPGRTTLTIKTAMQQHPTQVIPVESTHHYKFKDTSKTPRFPYHAQTPKKGISRVNSILNNSLTAPSTPTSSRTSKQGDLPKYLTNIVTEKKSEPSETIRITRIDYLPNEDLTNHEIRQIIVSPLSMEGNNRRDPLSVSNGVLYATHKYESNEFEVLLNKMQKRNSQLQDLYDKTETALNSLKKKFSELFVDRQKCEMKLLRVTDNLKRSDIRYENAQARLNILMKELNIRDEENAKLKKELIKLHSISLPASNTLAKVKDSHEIQEQLKKEKIKKKAVLAAALSALTKATDSEVQKRLGTLLNNTQKSIARIESKRRQFREEERKNIMGALEALSLINDSDRSESIVAERVITRKPDKWNQNNLQLMKNVWTHNSTAMFPTAEINETPKQKLSSSFRASDLISKINPHLTEDDKRKVLKDEINDEIATKITQADTEESSLPIVSGTKF